MTHVSKKDLDPKHFKRLYRQYVKTIAQFKKTEVSLIFDELLGEEEKIMLAKRFATIVMLFENNSTYRIAQLLHMSPSTVERLRNKMNAGEFEHIREQLTKHKEEYEAFWKTLETILRAGLPPRGRGRWKSTFEILGRE